MGDCLQNPVSLNLYKTNTALYEIHNTIQHNIKLLRIHTKNVTMGGCLARHPLCMETRTVRAALTSVHQSTNQRQSPVPISGAMGEAKGTFPVTSKRGLDGRPRRSENILPSPDIRSYLPQPYVVLTNNSSLQKATCIIITVRSQDTS